MLKLHCLKAFERMNKQASDPRKHQMAFRDLELHARFYKLSPLGKRLP